MNVLETRRLFLRQFTLRDEEAMVPVLGDAEVMRHGPGAQTSGQIRTWLQECMASYREYGFGPWALVRKDGGDLMGYSGLSRLPDVGGRPEIELGYRLARSFWGLGYATEAVQAVCDHAVGRLGLQRVVSIIDPANHASIHVAEKAGMAYECDIMQDGYTRPDRLFVYPRPQT